MRKFLASALAAVTAAGAVLATAAPANAGGYSYRRHHHGGSDKTAVAIAAGVAGLALGAALASDGGRRDRYYDGGYYNRRYYDRRHYDRGYDGGYYGRRHYYEPGYDRYYGRSYGYYDRPHRVCIRRERVWDPYIDRKVTIERRYAC